MEMTPIMIPELQRSNLANGLEMRILGKLSLKYHQTALELNHLWSFSLIIRVESLRTMNQ